jgi:copper transport protein
VTVAFILVARRGIDGNPALLALIATGLALLTSSLDSHAAADDSVAYVAVAVDWTHLAAVATWFGGLACLACVLSVMRERTDEAGGFRLREMVPRFSNVALLSVLVLVATGIFEAWLNVGSWGELVQTAYGLSITAKVVLLAVTLCFAAFNLLLVVPGLARSVAARSLAASSHVRHLAFAIRAEVALISLIFVVAAVLTGLSPAREEQASDLGGDAQPVDRVLNASGTDVRVQVEPASTGSNRFAVTLPGGIDPEHVERVQLTMSYAESEQGAQPVLLNRSDTRPGVWEGTSLVLSEPGMWHADLLVRQMGKDDVVGDLSFDISGAEPAMAPMDMSAKTDTTPGVPIALVVAIYALIVAAFAAVAVKLVRGVKQRTDGVAGVNASDRFPNEFRNTQAGQVR